MKIFKIKKSVEFKKIQNIAKKIHSKSFIFLYHPSIDETLKEKHLRFSRYGITISKKTCKLATNRNLIKRRISNIIRELKSNLHLQNYDFVIIAKQQIVAVNYIDLYNEFNIIFNQFYEKTKQTKKF